jgi:hypothetical protein
MIGLSTAHKEGIMWLLLFLFIPTLTFAQSPFPPPVSDPFDTRSNVRVYHPAPGVDSYWSQDGNTTVYDQGNNLKAYTQRDSTGNVIKQGYLFDPMASTPLRVDPPTPEQQMLDRFNGR